MAAASTTVVAAAQPSKTTQTQRAGDIVLADFEGDTYGDWKAAGAAFGAAPARGTIAGQMAVTGFAGAGLANSFRGGDAATGTLSSPQFLISRRYLSFLVGGGQAAGQLELQLWVDGRKVRAATGLNTRPGGSERLEADGWDIGRWRGQRAQLRIVDQATGGWGHINVDQIALTDRKPTMIARESSRDIQPKQRYLWLPVKNSAPTRRLSISAGGKTWRDFDIALADDQPDSHVFVDLLPFGKQPLTISTERLPTDSRALQLIEQHDGLPGAAELYREKLRPQFHFSSRRGWLNDPNGLVFFEDEYHLFYQHNPYGTAWGNMHWGHAVSRDLVHWQELPIALYPPTRGDDCFSGSAIVDWNNTSGFGDGKTPPLVGAFTSTARGECIIWSRDRGRTWHEYEGNPVVKHQGRDPLIRWHEATKQWTMAVYTEAGDAEPKKQSIAFYTSPDLKNWRYQSEVDGYFECPDLFELPIDGDLNNRRWVLLGADANYALGDFDGRRFETQSGKHRGNYGNCFYAAQTWSDIPARDGRRLQIGWARVDLPNMPFNQMMTFPCELSLRSTPDGPRLSYAPAREIETLRARHHAIKSQALSPTDQPLPMLQSDALDVTLELEIGQAQRIQLDVRGVPVVYDATKQELSCHNCVAPLPMQDGKIRLRLLIDRASIEIFAAEGLVYMPVGVALSSDKPAVELRSEGGAARLIKADIWELRSAWR